MLLKCCSVMVKIKIDDNIPIQFFFHIRSHIIHVIVLCRPTIRYEMMKKKVEPCCIRLYNWHNSSNKMLTQKEAKLFIYRVYFSKFALFIIYSRSAHCVCLCVCVLFFIRAFSTYFIMDDPLSKLGNHSSQLHNLLEFNIYMCVAYQLAQPSPSPLPLTSSATSLLCW